MIETLQAGQKINCTLVKLPRARADKQTILRLMRRDPAVVRGLRRSQKLRLRATVVYNRGNRDWVQRRKCAKIVELESGRNWSFVYDHSIKNDMLAVQDFVQVAKA